jgi:hypothetical protein
MASISPFSPINTTFSVIFTIANESLSLNNINPMNAFFYANLSFTLNSDFPSA